jgi:hypothetical protein
MEKRRVERTDFHPRANARFALDARGNFVKKSPRARACQPWKGTLESRRRHKNSRGHARFFARRRQLRDGIEDGRG